MEVSTNSVNFTLGDLAGLTVRALVRPLSDYPPSAISTVSQRVTDLFKENQAADCYEALYKELAKSDPPLSHVALQRMAVLVPDIAAKIFIEARIVLNAEYAETLGVTSLHLRTLRSIGQEEARTKFMDGIIALRRPAEYFGRLLFHCDGIISPQDEARLTEKAYRLEPTMSRCRIYYHSLVRSGNLDKLKSLSMHILENRQEIKYHIAIAEALCAAGCETDAHPHIRVPLISRTCAKSRDSIVFKALTMLKLESQPQGTWEMLMDVVTPRTANILKRLETVSFNEIKKEVGALSSWDREDLHYEIDDYFRSGAYRFGGDGRYKFKDDVHEFLAVSQLEELGLLSVKYGTPIALECIHGLLGQTDYLMEVQQARGFELPLHRSFPLIEELRGIDMQAAYDLTGPVNGNRAALRKLRYGLLAIEAPMEMIERELAPLLKNNSYELKGTAREAIMTTFGGCFEKAKVLWAVVVKVDRKFAHACFLKMLESEDRREVLAPLARSILPSRHMDPNSPVAKQALALSAVFVGRWPSRYAKPFKTYLNSFDVPLDPELKKTLRTIRDNPDRIFESDHLATPLRGLALYIKQESIDRLW